MNKRCYAIPSFLQNIITKQQLDNNSNSLKSTVLNQIILDIITHKK